MNCEYCGGSIGEGEVKCANCGAPSRGVDSSIPDYRTCPFCSRRLVALGSPACNYCGRRLPDEYIKAREGDLKRLSEVKGTDQDGESRIAEFLRESARSRGGSTSVIGFVDVASLFDIFS